MNNSDDLLKRAAVVSCYLDESGTGDNAPLAVLGGLLLNGEGADLLDADWLRIIASHKIEPPIHMTDFVPNGKHCTYPVELKRALFIELVEVINKYKIISIADTLSPRQFSKHFRELFDNWKVMGIYGMCFVHCVFLNHSNADHNSYKHRIPYLLDTGNPYRHHVLESHGALSDMQNSGDYLHLGPLSFENDAYSPPLQAADVIAWSVRRRRNEGFTPGFEPLAAIFDDGHLEEEMTPELMAQLEAAFRSVQRRVRMES
jgi:hypothetical protein